LCRQNRCLHLSILSNLFYFQIHITTTPPYFPPNPLKREPLFSSSPITCNFDSFPSFVLVPLVPVPFSPISQSKASYTPFNNNTMCLMLLAIFIFIFNLQFLQIQCFSLCSYSSLFFNANSIYVFVILKPNILHKIALVEEVEIK
jgi:hypothetical protein